MILRYREKSLGFKFRSSCRKVYIITILGCTTQASQPPIHIRINYTPMPTDKNSYVATDFKVSCGMPSVPCSYYYRCTRTQHLRCIFVGPSKSSSRLANANQKHWGGSKKQGNDLQPQRIHMHASPLPPPQPKALPEHCNRQEVKWSTKQAVSADTAAFVLERIVMVPGVERPLRPVRRYAQSSSAPFFSFLSVSRRRGRVRTITSVVERIPRFVLALQR